MDIIIFIGGLFQNIMDHYRDLFREKEVAPFSTYNIRCDYHICNSLHI